MKKVFKINKIIEKEKGLSFGAGKPDIKGWPKNPNGEKLELIFSINSNLVNENLQFNLFPTNTYIYVFSTYNKGYFLDDICFFGDEQELKYLKSGFTKVIIENDEKNYQNNKTKINVDIEKYELENDTFPAFSFLSNSLPNGLSNCEILLKEYYFAGQFYSADIPLKNGGVLGLSDANAYLFLKKEPKKNDDSGIFFVQTA